MIVTTGQATLFSVAQCPLTVGHRCEPGTRRRGYATESPKVRYDMRDATTASASRA
jgi:hypothetical protein